MNIREALDADLKDVLSIERAAFGGDGEAKLVEVLLVDPSARPTLSLLAFSDDRAVGHILFTRAGLTETRKAVSVALLAPLAVLPEAQKRGIGGGLVERGLQLLRESGLDLVFVLGHPEYYPRHGFRPAGRLGLEAPYPIPDENAAAWMVQAFRPGILGAVRGKVVCCDALNRPEYWRE